MILQLRYAQFLLALAALGVQAERVHAQPGPASPFSVLRLEPSARSAALGGSFSAVLDGDVNALFYNPALLNGEMHRAASFSYLNHLGGVHAGFIAYGRHLEPLGSFGAGIRFVTWGGTEGFDETGAETEPFGASDAALTLSYARAEDPRLRYGASLHGVFSSIASYAASALAADFGVAYHVSEARLTVSASANNVGLVLNSLGASKDRLPADLRVGLSKRLEYVPLLVSITGYNLNRIGEEPDGGTALGDAMRHVALGGEFQFSESFNVRLGYNHRRHQDLKMKSRLDMAGLGVGFGIRAAGFRFDYSFNSWSTLGGLHQFTLRTVI